MSYQIQLASFEGPFDLLLHLINKNEVDIYDIPIAEITNQYLEYIHAMESLDLDLASEFLVMAATLLSIKARMLLPKPPPELLENGEDFDPRLKLVQDLLEYKRIKEASLALETFYKDRQKLYQRPNEMAMYSDLFGDVNPVQGKTVDDLTNAFQKVWERAEAVGQVHAIQKDFVSIAMMIDEIKERLAMHPEGIKFEQVFETAKSKIHLVVGFLALLELSKTAYLKVQQSEAYGTIYLLPNQLAS